jgi:peptidoglycan/LPS O-acetylase OafA/YrhL
LVQFIIALVSEGVAAIAVPLFFVMSGYLFAYNLSWSVPAYLQKLRSRSRSLALPFLYWNVLVLCLFAIGESVPMTRQYFSGASDVRSFGVLDYLNAFFGVTRLPIVPQFWFLRDLIILCVISPLLYVIAKQQLAFIALAFMSLVWLFGLWPMGLWPIHLVSHGAVVFFFAGLLAGTKGYSLFGLDRLGKYVAPCYLVVLVLDALTKGEAFNDEIHGIGILLGVISVLYLSKFLLYSPRLEKGLTRLASASFFVFAAHEPLLTLVRKIAYVGLHPASGFMVLLLYFSAPILVICACVAAYFILKRILPTLTTALCGGR